MQHHSFFRNLPLYSFGTLPEFQKISKFLSKKGVRVEGSLFKTKKNVKEGLGESIIRE